jgi:transcription initiation factor TFIIIB Brf1 subunit/transcription initiation factor TFIIB
MSLKGTARWLMLNERVSPLQDDVQEGNFVCRAFGRPCRYKLFFFKKKWLAFFEKNQGANVFGATGHYKHRHKRRQASVEVN